MPQTKEEKRAKILAWQLANPDKVKEYQRRNRERHKDKILERGREAMRKWRAENPEESRRRVREYRQRNPEKVKARNDKRRLENPDYQREYRARNREKLLVRDRESYHANKHKTVPRNKIRRRELREKLSDRHRPLVCDVCNGPGGRLGIVFDHCHATETFRGWICSPCNSALGLAKDSPEILRKLALYLEKHRGQANVEGAQRHPDISLCWSQSLLSCPG